MRTGLRIAAAAALLALAGCVVEDGAAIEDLTFDEAGETVGTDPAGGLPEQCDAEDYRGLIGQNVAAVTLPEEPMLRVYGETDIVTQDYRPQRTNVIYDASGTIRRVTCG